MGTVNQAPVLTSGGGAGKVTTDFGPSDANARSVVVQADGKIVVTGYTTGSAVTSELVRYNRDGSLDATFGTGGIVTSGLSSATGSDITLQADGKIVVAGVDLSSGVGYFALARYNSDGSFDTSFGTGGKVTTHFGSPGAYTVTVQADGKIVLSGGSGNDFAAVRYDANGSLDASFGVGGEVTTSFGGSVLARGYGHASQPDGKVIVAGSADFGTGQAPQYDFALARYNTDGSLDASFGTGGKVTTDIASGDNIAFGVALQADGKVLVSGFSEIGSKPNFALVRYNADGSLDTSFGAGGKVTTAFGGSAGDVAQSITIQADGKIVAAGYSYSSAGPKSDFGLARYNSDGSLDTSFGNGGKVTTDFIGGNDIASGIVIDGDGKIIVVGNNGSNAGFDFALARYNSDGSLDTSFNPGHALSGTSFFTEGGSPAVLNATATVHDDELVAAGSYAGASLTLARHGGADAQDRFGASGNLAALTEGGNIVLSGVAIGTVTQNSGGTLLLTFGANATEARVNEAMRDITYANSSDNPAASVQVDWLFSDGNTGAQGSGGTLAAIGSTTVNMTAVNDAPVNTVPGAFSTHDASYAIAGLAVSDPDATSLTTTLHVDHGTLTVAAIGGATVGGSGTDTVTLAGSVAQINATLSAVSNVLYHGAFAGGTDHLTMTSNDGGGTGIGGTLSDTDTVAINPLSRNSAPDFNGDGNSDLLLLNNTSHGVAIWEMNGAQVIANPQIGTVNAAAGWHYQDKGDFNADGKTDLLMLNDTSHGVAIWQMDGAQVTANPQIGTINAAAGWHYQDTGDYNGDGKTDLLMLNDTTHGVAIWQMNGTQVTANPQVGVINAAAGWHYQDKGDFNGDGKTDLLMLNDTTHGVAIWQMDGTQVTANPQVGTINAAAGWHFAKTGDFNGDGKTDLLMLNDTTHGVAIWQMDGTQVTANPQVGTINAAAGWHFQDTGDFNGDGKTDLLMLNDTTHGVAIWQMNGTQVTANPQVGVINAAAGWHYDGLRDFNGDGKTDLLLENDTTHGVAVWLMDGTQVTANPQIGTVNAAADWHMIV
jgi:uncharacterized delta-60 repeat protein